MRVAAPGVGAVPRVEELLHARVQEEEAPQHRLDRRDEFRLTEPPLKEQQGHHRPIARVVPRHFRRHHLGVAHDGVLPVVQPNERVEQTQVGGVERLGARRHVLPVRIAHDEVGDVVVAYGDEIGAR